MAKQKRRGRGLLIFILLVAIGLGCFFGIKYYLEGRITFNVNDTLPDGQGESARVILLAGQSNASGCSLDEYLQMNVSAEKYAEYKNGYDNIYINYLSGKKMSEGFVKCSVLQGELDGAFGPELGLADKLNEMYPGEKIFIIKCAWGGTNLYDEWLSPSSTGKTGKLYKQFVTYVKTSLKYLESKNYDIKIEAMCWMQGESDSFMTDTASNYDVHLTNLIEDVRKEFKKYASDDGIAFVDAYIAESPSYWVYYEMVNQCKTKVAASSDMNVVIETKDLTTSGEPYEKPDMAHYDSMSEIALGHRFAEACAQFFD